MSINIKQITLLAIFTTTLFSCTKKDPIDETTGEMHLNFKNYVGDKEMVLGSETYTNQAGETFSVSMFNYYISNIKLLKNGGEYAEPESYHLVKQDQSSSGHFHIANVPSGEYTGMTFLIGVDEARNTAGAQTGALDQNNGMFWTWSTGYIMAKLEGTSTASTNGKFVYHIGGFTGENSGLRTITIKFPSSIKVNGSYSGEAVIKANAMTWFGPTNVISIAAVNSLMMPGATSRKIADNYASMFTLVESKSVAE